MAAISQKIVHFFNEILWILSKICSQVSNWQYGSIDLYTGLAPNWRQATIWSNVGMFYWRIFASLCPSMLLSMFLMVSMIWHKLVLRDLGKYSGTSRVEWYTPCLLWYAVGVGFANSPVYTYCGCDVLVIWLNILTNSNYLMGINWNKFVFKLRILRTMNLPLIWYYRFKISKLVFLITPTQFYTWG